MNCNIVSSACVAYNKTSQGTTKKQNENVSMLFNVIKILAYYVQELRIMTMISGEVTLD